MFDSVSSLFKHLEFLRGQLNEKGETPVTFDFKIIKMAPDDWKSIPIIINSYNRKKYLDRLISYLKYKGYLNIYIIDNNSSYMPLLDYYKEQALKVFYLSDNVGYLALWKTSVYDHFANNFYVYTDSDIVPSECVPDNFIEIFADILNNYPFLGKVGFSLDIEDLPEKSALSKKVIEDELKFWIYDVDDKFYFSPIDTTFALYRPNAKGGWWLNAGRSKKPYVAKHLPWYEEAGTITAEDEFYYNSANKSTRWSKEERKGKCVQAVERIINKCMRAFK